MKKLEILIFLILSIQLGCAFKSGFGGESKTEIGNYSFTNCGKDLLPDFKTEKLQRIYFVLGNINHDSLIEEPEVFKARLAKDIHGKCIVLETYDMLNLEQGDGYVGFKKVLVNNRAPFSHLGDDEECFRAEGTILLGLVDTTMDFQFSFQSKRSHFEENILEWTRELCN
jgi:hypothetical protein